MPTLNRALLVRLVNLRDGPGVLYLVKAKGSRGLAAVMIETRSVLGPRVGGTSRTARLKGAVGALLTGAVLAGGSAVPAAFAAGPVATGPLTIGTFAGGAGGPARASTVSIGTPCGVTSSGQTLLIGTNYEGLSSGVIRAVSAGSGQLTDLAGTNYVYDTGYSPDGTPATGAQFVRSCDVAMDHHGNLVFADSGYVDEGFRQESGHALVRVVPSSSGSFYGRPMVKGRVYTIAGDGGAGETGDGGPARQAEIGLPVGLAVDQYGNVVFASYYATGQIRVVAASTGTFYGQPMTAGDIYTVARRRHDRCLCGRCY